MRRRAVDRPSVTPEYAGCASEPWPSTNSSSPPRLAALDDQPLRRAGQEVGDHGVDGDPPAGDRDPGLPGRDEHRLQPSPARLEVELDARPSSSRSRSPSRRSARSCAGTSRFSPVGTLRPGGGLRRSRSSTPCRAASSRELRVVADELVQAALDVEPLRDRALQQLAPGRREAASLGRHPDDRGRRAEAERVVDGGDDRECRPSSPPPASSRAPRPRDAASSG